MGTETHASRSDKRFDALESHWDLRMEVFELRMASRMDQHLAAQARAMTVQAWAVSGTLLVVLVGTIVAKALL